MLACSVFLGALSRLDAHGFPPPPDEQPPAEQVSTGPTKEEQDRFDIARAVVEDADTKLSLRIRLAADLLKADWPEALQAVLDLLDNSGATGTCVPICTAIAGKGTPKLDYVDLAAGDRPMLRVLVLDGLYPDASDHLAQNVFAGWKPGMRRLRFLSNGLFALMNRTRIGDHRPADALPGLLGRDLLLLAPANDPQLTAEIQRMVRSIPDQRNVDGNMVLLPATHADGLYGEAAKRHREQVVSFFEDRLVSRVTAAAFSR